MQEPYVISESAAQIKFIFHLHSRHVHELQGNPKWKQVYFQKDSMTTLVLEVAIKVLAAEQIYKQSLWNVSAIKLSVCQVIQRQPPE